MDAVFAANDQMAISVIQAACQVKLRIPEELGVVGFDNIPEAPYFCPALTTVQSEQYNVGKIAVEKMINIIESSWQEQEVSEPIPIMLTPSLIVRESSLKCKLRFPKEVIRTEEI
jgi:DNA-binding LacI/PurR family transcriptional regulator